MEYAVFRFDRNNIMEQWIIPTSELLKYMGISKRKVTIPIVLSEHGNVCNLLFSRSDAQICVIQGHETRDTYVFFQPQVTLNETALNHLVDMWRTQPLIQKVTIGLPKTKKLYRL